MKKELDLIIYLTTNLINGKIYVGQDSFNRPNYLGSGNLIIRAIDKYGEENFKKEIIKHCKNIDELNKREIYWIDKLDATNPRIGYNLAKGGEGTLGIKHTEETKENLRQINLGNIYGLGRIVSEESRQKSRKSNLGKKHKEEVKKKIGESKLGKKLSKSHKRKIGEAMKGNTYCLGYKFSKESKRKMCKSVIQLDSITLEEIKIFSSIKEVKEELEIQISSCLKGRTKTSGGYKWKYKNVA